METLALDRSILKPMSKRYAKPLQCIDRGMLPCFSARCSLRVPVCHVSCPALRTALHAQERDRGVSSPNVVLRMRAVTRLVHVRGVLLRLKWNSKVGVDPALCFRGKRVVSVNHSCKHLSGLRETIYLNVHSY